MSVESLAVVLHHSRARGTAKLVLVGIANHDGDGGAYPSHATLARYANVDERNVRRAIDGLVSKGELAVQVQEGGDRDLADHRRPNRYRVLVACPSWCDRSPQHRDTRPTRVQGTFSTRGALPPPVPPEGGALAPRGGRALPPPKPSSEPNPLQVVPQPQDTRPCQDCGQGEARCQAIQQVWSQADRHPYRAVEVRHATGR